MVWSGESDGFRRLPCDEELDFRPDVPYLHYVSNETVEGLQFHRVLGPDGVPRVCDMSSDFLSEPCDLRPFSLVYAHAQKNIGPAGVTVILIRDGLLAGRAWRPARIPRLPLAHRNALDLQHAAGICNLRGAVDYPLAAQRRRWIEADGRNQPTKGRAVIQAARRERRVDCGKVASADRSRMNVTFNLPSRELECAFFGRGRGGRVLRPGRAPLDRRHSGLDLQRDDSRCRRATGRFHGPLSPAVRTSPGSRRRRCSDVAPAGGVSRADRFAGLSRLHAVLPPVRIWREITSRFRCRADFSPPGRTKVEPTICC